MSVQTTFEETGSVGQQGNAYCPCCGSHVSSAEVVFDREQGVVALNGKFARLTSQQSRIATVLLRKWPQAASTDSIIYAMYDGDEPQEAPTIVCIQISKMRDLLTPLGLTIRNDREYGYKLTIPKDNYINKLSVNRRAA
jgi:DNA-binding response OmpR family regulator